MFKKSKRTQIRQRIRSESEEEEDEGKTETSEPPKQEEKLENTGVSSLFKKQTEVDFKSFDSLTQSNENSQQSTDDNNSGGSGSGNGSLFGKQQAAAAKKKTAALSFLHHEDEEEVEGKLIAQKNIAFYLRFSPTLCRCIQSQKVGVQQANGAKQAEESQEQAPQS